MYQQVSVLPSNELRARKRRNITRKIISIATVIFVLFFCFLQTFPFYLQIVTSLHGLNYIRARDTLYLWPRQFSPSNYLQALRQADFVRGLVNSAIHTVSFTLITLIVAFIFGYVLGKIKFRGKNIVFIAILSTLMVPGEVLMIPNFLLVQRIGWTDNLLGIILPGAVNVFGIFLFKQFMNTIPDELLESANIDGASEFTKIFRIVFPMCKPVITTFVIITFTAAWNEYLWPMIVINDPTWFTIQLIMNQFFPRFPLDADQYLRAAGMILISLPIIILFLTQQRHFLQSLNVSGMK